MGSVHGVGVMRVVHIAAVAALLFLLLIGSSKANSDAYLTCYKHNQTINTTRGNFTRAITDDDMQPLYEANLSPDIVYWNTVTTQRGRIFSVADIVEQFKRMMWSPYVGIIIVQRGVPYRFKSTSMLSFATLRIIRLQREITKLVASGHHVPNTILIFNAEDVPICHRLQGCRVPVFTLFKRIPTAEQLDGSQTDEYPDEEILLPNFNQDWDRLCFYPWDLKNNSALMRASLQVTMSDNSTRRFLSKLAMSSSEAAEMLDAGIVRNPSKRFNVSAGEMRHFLGLSKHAYWRFLLNTDGHTASSRLGHLLGMNSVVLKERSPWVEYYYRALVPGQDHLDFEPASILELLKNLRSESRSEEMQHIAAAGQRFAYRYLHTRAKALYTRQAILRYNQLFSDLESFVERLPLAKGTYTGRMPPTLRDLISTLSDLTGVPL